MGVKNDRKKFEFTRVIIIILPILKHPSEVIAFFFRLPFCIKATTWKINKYTTFTNYIIVKKISWNQYSSIVGNNMLRKYQSTKFVIVIIGINQMNNKLRIGSKCFEEISATSSGFVFDPRTSKMFFVPSVSTFRIVQRIWC